MLNSHIKQYSPYSSFDKERICLHNKRIDIPEELKYNANLQTTKKMSNDLLKINMQTKSNDLICKSNHSFISYDSFQKTNRFLRSSTFNHTEQLSKVEEQLLKSLEPIEFSIENSNEEIEVLGQKGIWLNKDESLDWHGKIPLCNYEINKDERPHVVYKKPSCELNYVQELAVRYLRPPTPPIPGDIVIIQEPNKQTPPAPPVVIRQHPAKPVTPEPIVIREAPPKQPPSLGKKLIIISGKRLPPPPRKVIIERLAELPPKPPDVIIERWLPYKQIKRKVIFQRFVQKETIKPKNIIIQWQAPQVHFFKQFKDLGIIKANPGEYIAKYGKTLKKTEELPDFILECIPPSDSLSDTNKTADQNDYDLEGDIDALR